MASSSADTPESLLRDADAAMYRAKERGRGRYELFDERMRATVLGRMRTETELRHALDRDEMRVHYQPIVDVQTGDCIAVEALARWEHPRRGLLLPAEFIPVAEETGLITALGHWVLDAACRQGAGWQARFGADLQLCVNVSGQQLATPLFAAEAAEVAQRSGLARGTLVLEITESVLIEEAESPMAMLASLREHDLRLSLDDFGTGYSSLAYLKRFALDALKIDRSFIDGLGSDPDDSAIVEAVIKMAQTIGMQVVAEGVETNQQLDQLRELGCPAAQGYLFSRPQPPDRLEDFLAGRVKSSSRARSR